MSQGMNKVMLLGNLGADPELRYTKDGLAVMRFRLATTENYLDKHSIKQEKTEWHDVTVWGNRGEALSKILKKGTCVLVEGGLRTSSWEKDGVKKWRTEVIARDVWLTARRPANTVLEDATFENPSISLPPPPPSAQNGTPYEAESRMDEVPF